MPEPVMPVLPVLIVEDEEPLRKNLVRYLEQQGHAVFGFATAEEALAAAGATDFAAAVVDLRLPGMDGLSLAGELYAVRPDTGVIVMTSYSSVGSVIDALRIGVQDYLIKPVLLKDVAGLAGGGGRLPVARSRAMQELFAFVRQVAPSSATVLLSGESGSGKEV